MSVPEKQQQVLLARRPRGKPTLDDFKVIDAAVPAPKDGEMLVQTLFLSVDPGMRSMMAEGGSHGTGFELDKPLTGRSVGRVVSSRLDGFAEGDFVCERLGWQQFSISDGSKARKVDPAMAPLSTYLGVVGVPGFCGYFGIKDIGRPRAGETVVVSGASGAVGMTAAQLARLDGCRVVGIAGGDEKVSYLRDVARLDAVVDYKTTQDLRGALRSACPDGVDVYFDNVGGDVSADVLSLINHGARIVICGQASQYNGATESGRIAPDLLIQHSALMQGFVVYDYESRTGEAVAFLSQRVRDGSLCHRETIVEGLENAPQAFIDLFHSKSFGKQLVRVAR